MSILKILEDSSRRILADSSGSMPGMRNEKIRAGQSYLYKLHGMESEVLEIRLAEKVHGDALNRALRKTLQRFPWVNTRALELDGDFYIVQNPVSMTVLRSQHLASLGSVSCGYHLVDITWYGSSLFISFHHALCDGRGIMAFAETLIWCYFQERRMYSKAEDGVALPEEPLHGDEALDPFFQDFGPVEKTEDLNLPREGYHIREGDEDHGEDSWRYEVIFDHDPFIRKMKDLNATPAILVSLLMSRAICSVRETDRPVLANIAFDMRKALCCENSFKNCVSTLTLPYRGCSSCEETVSAWRDLMNRQRSPERCRNNARMMQGLFEKLDSLSSFETKQSIMGFFDGMALDSFVLSYPGRMRLGANMEMVDEIHLYNSGTKGLGVNMIDTGRRFCVDIKQSFPCSDYAEAFRAEALRLGLSTVLRPAIEFRTPCDSLVRRKKSSLASLTSAI